MKKLTIVADENLACLKTLFGEHNLAIKGGRHIQHADLEAADILLVRSVTQVNAKLLQGTPVQFVGSATIGTDHLDLAYLNERGITVAYAPGCNAQAVVEYVLTALLYLRPAWADSQPILGIIGLGNIGGRLAHAAQLLGWQVIAYDPYVQRDGIQSVELDALLQQADAVTLHTPLTRSGQHATHHLIDAAALERMKPDAILINAARGALIDEHALMADLDRNQRQVVLDVFEHEPHIPDRLLAQLTIATPHIAGYTLEGKVRGSLMLWQALQQWAGQSDKAINLADLLPPAEDLQADWLTHLRQSQWLRQDDQQLRHAYAGGDTAEARQSFDMLRKNYSLRREWPEEMTLPPQRK